MLKPQKITPGNAGFAAVQVLNLIDSYTAANPKITREAVQKAMDNITRADLVDGPRVAAKATKPQSKVAAQQPAKKAAAPVKSVSKPAERVRKAARR